MSRGSTEGRSDSFRPVLGATVLLFLAVLAVAGVRSWRDLETARQSEHSLESQITETEAQIARLRNRIERLRSDPGTLERRAREDLGMVRPGDVVIELPATSPPGPPQTAAPEPVPVKPAGGPPASSVPAS